MAIGDLRGALTGSIEISNERHRVVQIYVDGRFALEIAPRSTAVLPDVPNGIRLIGYGDREHRFQVDRVEVRIDRRAALRIAPLRGVALIRNDSPTPMRVSFGDADLGVLLPGAEVSSPPLVEGSYMLRYSPKDAKNAPPRTQRVGVVPGESTRVSLQPFFATLVVRNPFPFDVNLFVDGERLARIDRFAEIRLDTLLPGRLKVELRARQKLLEGAVVEVEAGRSTRWDPQVARFGDLEVTNPSRFPVRIQIGALTAFRLDPGESRFFSNLEAGPTNIQLTLQDGRVVMHAAEIRPGDRVRFEVPRQAGSAPAPGGRPVPVRPDTW